MRQDIVNALDYFRRKTFATAVFIRIQEGFAYSIEEESKVRYDFIPIFELDEFIERLGVCHQIQSYLSVINGAIMCYQMSNCWNLRKKLTTEIKIFTLLIFVYGLIVSV